MPGVNKVVFPGVTLVADTVRLVMAAATTQIVSILHLFSNYKLLI